ncbi:MAG TPA: hypothetical protein PKW59_12645 [Thermotogota bacterium]|nr:hypothetical protein [Thermotogota bacterium]
MQKAYDTFLQSVVEATYFSKNTSSDPYRFECICCGEEVFIAAADSKFKAVHFRHRSGNNDVECENYLHHYRTTNVDPKSRKGKSERAEFFFEQSNKDFHIGLRFSSEEIAAYEQVNAKFELRSSPVEEAFISIPINKTNFAPDTTTQFPIRKSSPSYFLSNTHSGTKREYVLFKSPNIPVFFKLQGNDSDYKAKLVRGGVLYTNVAYFVAIQNRYPLPNDISFPSEVHVDDSFSFKTMGRNFSGKVLTIKNKTSQLDALIMSWGYRLEASETLTLLWPPSALMEDLSIIYSDYVYLYSSFELRAHGNINVRPEDLYSIASGVTKVSIKLRTKVFKKNVEIIIDEGEQNSSLFDEIRSTRKYVNTFTLQDDSTYFLFSSSGVKPLSKGQSISLTPRSEIRRYHFGYLVERINPIPQKKLSGELLLDDILAHCKRTEAFDSNVFNSHSLSDVATQYIKKCNVTGIINSTAKRYIEEDKL